VREVSLNDILYTVNATLQQFVSDSKLPDSTVTPLDRIDRDLVSKANRLVFAYVLCLVLLTVGIFVSFAILREEMQTQRNLSEANTHINAIHRSINDSVSLLQRFREAVGASSSNSRLVQVIERRISKVITELDSRASLLAVSMGELEGKSHWDDVKLIWSGGSVNIDMLLERYVGQMRQLISLNETSGRTFIGPQFPSEAAGARHGALSNGFKKASDRLSEIMVRHAERIEAIHNTLTLLQLCMLVLISFLVVLPLWKRLINEHKRHEQANRKLHHFAYTDQETGLPNLDGFEQHFLLKALPPHKVHEQYLLLIQISNLYEIYNLIGSQRISELHQLFSGRLATLGVCKYHWVRSSDTEYVGVISDEKYKQADDWVGPFYNLMSSQFVVSGIIVRPIIALSVSQLDRVTSEAKSLLREHLANARMALPQFDRTMNALPCYRKAITHELAMQNEMITAVGSGVMKNEFVPYYQIKVDATTGEPRSFEVLCRWLHESGDIVDPHVFLSAAEKSGQIVPITYQLLKQVVIDVEKWSKMDLRVGPVAINVSIDVLQDKSFITRVCQTQKLLQAMGSDLEIEITENVVIDNSTGVIRQVLEQLSSRGIRIAIDDFGTGYASLQTLIDLPFDVLKIDRSFVVSMTKAGVGNEVISALISLTSKLEKRSVIEGVEFEWQQEKLAKMGANELQGYLFHKPASACDVGQWLEHHVERFAAS